MIGTVKQYKVMILGQPYTFVSDEAEEMVHAALCLLEMTTKDMAQQINTVELEKVALLSALCLSLKHVHLQQDIAAQADQQAKLMNLLTCVDEEL